MNKYTRIGEQLYIHFTNDIQWQSYAITGLDRPLGLQEMQAVRIYR